MTDQERFRRARLAHEREFAEARCRRELDRVWREWALVAVALSVGFWAVDRFVMGRSLPAFWACWATFLALSVAGLVAVELVLHWAFNRRGR